MLLCARCYPKAGTPADVWAEMKATYSSRRGVTVSTARTYEAMFDERTLHGRRSKRQQTDNSPGLWDEQEVSA